MTRDVKRLPDAELAVMQALWACEAPAGRSDLEGILQGTHPMAATTLLTLLSRLAAEPAFGMTEAEMEAVLDPKLYIGRCPEQVDAFLAQVRPLLSGASREVPEISL